MLNWIFKFLLGDDIFISYSRADGATYAAGLANELAKLKFSCKIDQWGTESGAKMPKSLKNSLKRSAVLVLVGTEGAAKSDHVRDEIVEFKKTKRMIVPIVFDGVLLANDFTCMDGALIHTSQIPEEQLKSLTYAKWAKEIEGLPISCEKPEALKSGVPTEINSETDIVEKSAASEETDKKNGEIAGENLEQAIITEGIVSRIEKTFTFSRKDERLKKTSMGVAVLLILLIAASGVALGAAIFANIEAEKQKVEAVRLTKLADEARENAATEQKKAEIAKNEADDAKNDADEQKRIAGEEKGKAEKASELAAEKTKLAEEQTRLANEAETRAGQADQRRTEAEKREEIAKEETKKQIAQANSNLAENYYNIAETETRIEPIKALPWLQKSIDIIPDTNERLGIYKLRALHLTQNVPYSITNTMIYSAYSKIFSQNLDKAILTSTTNSEIWNLKTGTPLPVPLDKTSKKPVDFKTPIFSPNSRWIAAFTYEENPNSQICLNVWEAENVGNFQKNCYSRLDQLKVVTRFQEEHLLVYDDSRNIYFSPDSNEIIVDIRNSNNEKHELLVWNTGNINKEPVSIDSDVLVQESAPQTTQSADGTQYAKTVTYDQIKEQYHRNNLRFSSNPQNNWLIRVKNEPESSIVNVVDIGSGIAKKDINLEKIIDFIEFTGNGNWIFTISHNTGGKRVYRTWNAETSECIYRSEEHSFDIIALSKTGNKMLVQFKESQDLVIYGKNERGSYSREVSMDAPYEIYAFFTDDEKYLITESITKITRPWGDLAGQEWEINVWEEGNYRYASPLKPPVKIKQGLHFYTSKSLQALATATENGTVSLHNLLPGQNNFNKQFSLPLEENQFFDETYLTPDSKKFITLDSPLVSGDNRNFKVQFWNAETRKVEWSQNVVEAHIWDSVQNIDFNMDGKRFLMVQGNTGQNIATVRRLDNGEIVSGFQPIRGEVFSQAIFNRDGSKVLTFDHSLSNMRKVRQWDALTGAEDQSFKLDIPYDETNAPFQCFTRYGEYLIFFAQASTRNFKIRQTSGGTNSIREFQLLNRQTAALAISLLKQAQEIKFEGKENLVAVINPELTISLETSNKGTFIYNYKTRKKILAPNTTVIDTFDMKISPDGKLILGKPERKIMRLWSAETGFPITEAMWHSDEINDFNFIPENNKAVSITSYGKISEWFIGSFRKESSVWMKDMGEALSGLRIDDGSDPQNILQDEYLKIRNSYLNRLRAAEKKGDLEAQFILSNLNQ